MNMSTFQLFALGLFVVLILVGVGVFATGGLKSGSPTGSVVIWGTIDSNTMEDLIQAMHKQDASFDQVTYVQKDPSTYASDLVDAMASGKGPDLFLVTQDLITSFSDKVSLIPYSAVSQQTFTDSYIDEGNLFLTPQGALALPFSVDPLVMYWNHDLLASAGVAQPPANWTDFLDMAPRVTKIDASSNITTSAVALGQWSNIQYAKDILATLILQAGDPIVERDATTGAPTPVLGTTPPGATENPASSALQFYAEFANPSKTIYSWNGAMPNSQDAFVAGDLAVYFGRASDYQTLSARNPNLRFGVALVPQIKGSSVEATFGELTGVAIARTSLNQRGALSVAEGLTSQAAAEALAGLSPLPPVRRDVSIDTSTNAAEGVFVQSALIAHGWLDPDPSSTDQIFSGMIQSVVSSAADPSSAVFAAEQSLETLLHTNTIQTQ